MRISRFQLKLTLIFLLSLLIPAMAATFFTMYIHTLESNVMVADERVEAVLQEASDIAYDMIDEARAECQSIAEEISFDAEIVDSLYRQSAPRPHEEVEELMAGILPFESDLLVTIFDLRGRTPPLSPLLNSAARDSSHSATRDQPAPRTVIFSTSADGEDIPSSVTSSLIQGSVSNSYQEGDMVYGTAPVFEGDSLIGAVVVYQRLKAEFVRNIIALKDLLGVYAIKPELGNWIIWAGLVVLVFVMAVAGAVLAALLAKSVTKPILSLVDGTREIAKGNLDYRVEVKGKDEIATLMESFNSMTSQLKSSRERLLRAERLAAWRDIARRIAHEIKNPLTPIQLSMYRLRKNLGSERYDGIFQQAYTSITNEVENLRNMVTEFSNFARMPKPRTSPSSPTEIVQDAINLYTGLPDSITLHTELSDDLPQVMVDRDQIRQVLHNIIGNAVDAMSDGGQLSVTIQLEADDIVIKISDTGCGMSDEVRQRIFTPYFTTKETGTGLGMAITAQIIEEHGGEISVDSEEGVGTTVTVKLKAAAESIDKST